MEKKLSTSKEKKSVFKLNWRTPIKEDSQIRIGVMYCFKRCYTWN
jgi:hypothetical protein